MRKSRVVPSAESCLDVGPEEGEPLLAPSEKMGNMVAHRGLNTAKTEGRSMIQCWGLPLDPCWGRPETSY